MNHRSLATIVAVAILLVGSSNLLGGEVPGILKDQIDMESVIGLIAPRPHLTLTGDEDRGSLASGVRTINAFQEKLYDLYGRDENFRGVLYPGVGHIYTDQMWEETIAWLKEHL